MNKLKELIKTILTASKSFLLSPRLVAFYWSVGGMVVVQFLNIVSEQLLEISAPGWAIIAVGLMTAQVTKAINNKQRNKDTGFSSK